MAEIEQENKKPTPAYDKQPASAAVNSAQPDSTKQAAMIAQPPENIEKTEKPEMSKGEKVFNWGAYTGLNYWVNLISSVAIADYFINLGGREKMDKWINATARTLHKAGATLKGSHYKSKVVLESLILTGGGLMLLAPLKWLEDRKRPVVHWLNKKLGVKQLAPDGYEANPDEIHIEQEQPKQSWGNVLWRRVIGTVAVGLTGLAIDKALTDKTDILDPKTYDLGKGFGKVTYDAQPKGGKQWLTEKGFGLVDKASELVRGKPFVKNGITSRWTQLAILDSAFTAITAITMKMTNGAKKAKMPHEIDNSDDPKVVKDTFDEIITEDQIKKSHSHFRDRVDKRTKDIIKAKQSDASASFAEAVMTNGVSPATVGV